MALTEVALLFDALPWCGELPEEVQDWICGLPNEWAQRQVSLDERAAVFGFLQGRGWLQAMLAPSPSEVIATRFSSFARSFAERWSACPDSEALVAACPGLEKAWTTLLGVVHQKHAVREVAVSRVCAAVLRSPEDADAFLAHAQGALAHDAHWSSMRTVLRTVAALRQAGWNSGDPEFEQNLAWSGVCMAHGWGEAHQVAFVDSMKLAGFDFSANGCLGLTRLVDQEATLSNPLGMAQLLPLATALIDRGVDLRGMPQVEDPDRPLGCVVRVAREYQQMQDRAQAAVAGPRRCRL